MWAQRHTTLAKQNAEAALRLARDRYSQALEDRSL